MQPPTTRSILRRLTRSPRSPFGPGTPCKSEEEISSYLGCCAELRHENVSFCSGQRHFSLTSVKMGSRKGTGGTGSPTKQNGVFVDIKCLDLSWRDAAVWSQGSGTAQQYCRVTMSSPVIPSHLPTPTPRSVWTSIKCVVIPQAPSEGVLFQVFEKPIYKEGKEFLST